jgi:hypothetical protein
MAGTETHHNDRSGKNATTIAFRSVRQLQELGFKDSEIRRAAASLRHASDQGKAFMAFSRAFIDPENRLLPGVERAVSLRGNSHPLNSKHSFGLLTEIRLSDVTNNLNTIVPAVSSARLSQKLLESLGIPFSLEGKGSKQTVKITPNLTHALLTVFANLIPIPGTDGRLFIITTGERHAEQHGVRRPGLAGSLLYLRRDPQRDDVLMHFDDLPSVLRKTTYQLLREDQEIKEVSDITTRARALRSKLPDWSSYPTHQQAQLKAEASENAALASRDLRNSRDPSKRAAGNQLSSSRELKDSSGRINPTAATVRHTWAIKHLEKRQGDIPRIAGYNRADQSIIVARLEANATAFRHIRDRAEMLLSNFQSLGIFQSSSSSSKTLQAQGAGIVRNLGIASDQLNTIITRPDLTFRDRIESERATFLKAVGEKSRDNAHAALERIYLLASLACFQSELNAVRQELGLWKLGKHSDALAKLDTIRSGFATLQSRRLSVEKAFPTEFRGLKRSFTAAVAALQEYQLSKDERSLQKTENALDQLDFERRLLS